MFVCNNKENADTTKENVKIDTKENVSPSVALGTTLKKSPPGASHLVSLFNNATKFQISSSSSIIFKLTNMCGNIYIQTYGMQSVNDNTTEEEKLLAQETYNKIMRRIYHFFDTAFTTIPNVTLDESFLHLLQLCNVCLDTPKKFIGDKKRNYNGKQIVNCVCDVMYYLGLYEVLETLFKSKRYWKFVQNYHSTLVDLNVGLDVPVPDYETRIELKYGVDADEYVEDMDGGACGDEYEL